MLWKVHFEEVRLDRRRNFPLFAGCATMLQLLRHAPAPWHGHLAACLFVCEQQPVERQDRF